MTRKIVLRIQEKKIKYLLVAAFSIMIAACSHNSVYSDYKSIADAGWNKDSVARFTVDITETGIPCNVLVNIRHNNTYPYQNFWLFIATTSPEGKTTQDTIECYLADNRGKWLGSGLSSVYNMPVLFKPNTVFTKPGKYTFAIRQGMRDDLLPGITDIGIEINKADKK
jgi:gliding motility-associated lipoprotein GldH